MADVPDRLAAALADRYRLERELGAGGMATVYLAHDLKHDRDVALKVLRPELAEALGAERFLREIRITANLQHPRILPLLDSGQAGGPSGLTADGGRLTAEFLYYVMPYVEGASLRERLRQGGPLPPSEVVTLARQVASALGYAHEQGVIHRDIKPGNILLHRGEAVVADFGIARALASATPGEALTRTGVPLGTPGYMSPEQAAALRLDARSDVFSLGCVVYEMLVGATPEVWPTDEAGRLGRFVDASAAHRERLDRLPGRLEQALVRALVVRPEDRFPSAAAFADALEAAAEPAAVLPEAEVRRVLSRAAELQLEQPTGSGELTLGQVEQIAAEVGIPPEHVRAALQEREAASRAVPVVRGPADVVRTGRAPAVAATPGIEFAEKRARVVRVVPREVTSAELESLVAEIQATLGLVGHTSIVGRSLTWSPAAQGAGGRQLVVTVSNGGGRTEIRVEERIALTGELFLAPPVGAMFGAFAGLGIGTALGSVLGEPGVAIVLCGLLCGIGGGTGTAATVLANLRKKREPQLVALADRLAVLLERGTPSP
jgi:hypothetical protein